MYTLNVHCLINSDIIIAGHLLAVRMFYRKFHGDEESANEDENGSVSHVPDWRLLNAFTLTGLAIFLALQSLLNFSAAALFGAFYVPVFVLLLRPLAAYSELVLPLRLLFKVLF